MLFYFIQYFIQGTSPVLIQFIQIMDSDWVAYDHWHKERHDQTGKSWINKYKCIIHFLFSFNDWLCYYLLWKEVYGVNKDFKDFQDLLTEEQMLEIFNTSVAKIESAKTDGMANNILAISINCSIELLKLYHEWSQKQD